MKSKTFVYSDPLNDDFAGTDIKTKETPADYVYLPRSVFYRAAAFLFYYAVAFPITYIYDKIAFHHRFVNKKVLKQLSGKGCFFYGNHALKAGDAFIPNHLCARRNYMIVSADDISIPGLKTIVKMLGGLPLPYSVRGSINYQEALREVLSRGNTVTVYPEAHIWPRYTGIRPFSEGSFALPVKYGVPCFSFTNVFLRSRIPFVRRPVVKTYINGPFYPDESLPKKQRIRDLRDRVYGSMVYEAEKQEQYVTYRYIQKEPEEREELKEA